MSNLVEVTRQVFEDYYAANIAEGDTMQGLIFPYGKCPEPTQYFESLFNLSRERIVEMWEVQRARVDSADRGLEGYQKVKTLAELAQFSLLAETIVANGFIQG